MYNARPKYGFCIFKFRLSRWGNANEKFENKLQTNFCVADKSTRIRISEKHSRSSS